LRAYDDEAFADTQEYAGRVARERGSQPHPGPNAALAAYAAHRPARRTAAGELPGWPVQRRPDRVSLAA
jgi:hypothetical protein